MPESSHDWLSLKYDGIDEHVESRRQRDIAKPEDDEYVKMIPGQIVIHASCLCAAQLAFLAESASRSAFERLPGTECMPDKVNVNAHQHHPV